MVVEELDELLDGTLVEVEDEDGVFGVVEDVA